MKRIAWIAILIAPVLWPGAPRAQSEAPLQAYRQGQAHLQEGRYGDPIASHETALALAEGELGAEQAATLLNELAEVYRGPGAAAAKKAAARRRRAQAARAVLM